MACASPENKSIARKMASIFGGDFRVITCWDDNNASGVDVLSCKDQPTYGDISYGTIGLSDHPLIDSGVEFPARLELIGVSASCHAQFPNILATAAFYIINDQWFCWPGAIFPGIVEMYYEDIEMKHLMFATPLLWGDDDWDTQQFGIKTVAWLMIVPISENERIFAINNGADALENLLIEREIDVFDLYRSSVL